MEFSDQLKAARIAAGLTQRQVADAMGITNSTYCGYETGKREPDVAKIKQLSKILGVPADDLLDTGLSAEIEPTEEEIRQRINIALDRLTLYGKKKVAEYAEDLAEPRYREMTQEELRELYGRGGPRKAVLEKQPPAAPETPPEGEQTG